MPVTDSTTGALNTDGATVATSAPATDSLTAVRKSISVATETLPAADSATVMLQVIDGGGITSSPEAVSVTLTIKSTSAEITSDADAVLSTAELNEAKTAAYVGVKEKYESQMKSIVGDWGVYTLIAIAAKTSSPKTDEETDVITDIKILSDNLAADIDAIQAATDVATIDSILNS